MRRTSYDNKFWRDSQSDRIQLHDDKISQNSYGVTVSQSSWPTDAPSDFLTRTTVPSINAPSNNILKFNNTAGELQNTYQHVLTSSVTPNRRVANSTISALYSRKHLIPGARSVASPSGMPIPETGSYTIAPIFTDVIDLLLKGNRSGDIGSSVYVGIHAGNTAPTSNIDNILFKTAFDQGGYMGWVKTASNWRRFGPISKSAIQDNYDFDNLDVGTNTTLNNLTVSGTSGHQAMTATNITASGTVQAEQLTSTDDANIADDLTVGGTATADKFVGNGIVPIGGIIMWSGSDGNVPTNWVLCNNSSAAQAAGAPNLVDRFVVGRGSKYAAGDKDGSADAVLVSHSHTTNSTSKTLTGSVGKISETYATSGTATGVFTKGSSANAPNTPGGPDSSPSGSFNFDGTHTHGTDAKGVSGTDKNLPPYYAIAYIMRVS